jgi:hypothetical protein
LELVFVMKAIQDSGDEQPQFNAQGESTMNYFEFPSRDGDGRCSDNACPCPEPGTRLPRGTGYLYISPQAVEFRTDCLTWEAFLNKMDRIKSFGNAQIFMVDMTAINPVIMCEQGATKRGLDLAAAAADARDWWECGKALLRATPLANTPPATPPAMTPPVTPPPKKWWQFWK